MNTNNLSPLKTNNWTETQMENDFEVEKNEFKESIRILMDVPERHHYDIELEYNLDKTIVGQKNAKKEIIDAIMSRILSIRERKWPIACLLFTWPTWVWKTEIVKSLAKFLLWNENNFTKIACENYIESHSTTTLFWAPKSFTWYWDPSPLSHENITRHFDSAKRMNQLHDMVKYLDWFNIILFDEIEKAHYNVKQSLLWMMDTWKIEFTNSKISRFDNSIIVFTSNVWQHEIVNENSGNSMGFIGADKNTNKLENSKITEKALKKEFSPEFIERLTSTINFDYLTKENCLEILDINIKDLNEAILKRYPHNNIFITLDENAYEYIITNGYTKEKWARKLVRTFNKKIELKLNLIFNSESFQRFINKNNWINISVDVENNEVKFYLSTVEKTLNKNESQELIALSKQNTININWDSKLKEMNFLFSEISQYIELFYMNLEWDVDFREDLIHMEDKLKSYWLTFNDILQIRNRAYIESLNDLNFITTFDWISIFSEEKKDVFHPYSQKIIFKTIEKQIEKYSTLLKNDDIWIYILNKILPIISKLLRKEELSTLQINEIIIYLRKIIIEKYSK